MSADRRISTPVSPSQPRSCAPIAPEVNEASQPLSAGRCCKRIAGAARPLGSRVRSRIRREPVLRPTMKLTVQQPNAREIKVKLLLAGGQSVGLTVPPEHPVLAQLLAVVAGVEGGGHAA